MMGILKMGNSSKENLRPASSESELRNWVEEAFSRLMKLRHGDVAKKCGVVYLRPKEGSGAGRFIVNLLNKTYTVELSSMQVVDLISGREAGSKLTYVIVEYLVNGDGSSLGSSWIPTSKILTTQELSNYFKKAILRPLIQTFGYNKEGFEEAAKALGGKREKLGGVSFSFLFLPKVKLLCQIWPGDKRGFTQPAANMSNSDTALNYLPKVPLLYACEGLVNFLAREASK